MVIRSPRRTKRLSFIAGVANVVLQRATSRKETDIPSTSAKKYQRIPWLTFNHCLAAYIITKDLGWIGWQEKVLNHERLYNNSTSISLSDHIRVYSRSYDVLRSSKLHRFS